MNKNLSELLGALPTLSHEELATVRGAIDHLLSKRSEGDDPTIPLFNSILKVLSKQMAFSTFTGTSAYRAWKANAPVCVSFIETTWPEASKVAKGALMVILIDMLIDDLQGRGVPVTIGTITNNLDRIPQLFDLAYPDYIKMGMAHVVLKALERGE